MSAFPILSDAEPDRELPDYLPARMVNEFSYCPRLFFYEWVEGVFQESVDTIEGAIQHRRVDAKTSALPPGETPENIHARSVTLSSERLRVIAKMDLVESDGETVTPVDYKHGNPREGKDGLELWPSDRAQLAVQAIVLRENGYAVEEGIVYYRKTGQRVRIRIDNALVVETEALIERAWRVAREGQIPPALEDSPKCAGCSLNSICLPDEMLALSVDAGMDGWEQMPLFGGGPPRKPVKRAVRALITPRSELRPLYLNTQGLRASDKRESTLSTCLRPLYLNTQGLRVGKSGAVLQVKEKDTVVQEVRLGEICQVSLMGNVQVSTQAIQALCESGIPICYFSMGGWFYGITTGLNQKNVFRNLREPSGGQRRRPRW